MEIYDIPVFTPRDVNNMTTWPPLPTPTQPVHKILLRRGIWLPFTASRRHPHHFATSFHQTHLPVWEKDKGLDVVDPSSGEVHTALGANPIQGGTTQTHVGVQHGLIAYETAGRNVAAKALTYYKNDATDAWEATEKDIEVTAEWRACVESRNGLFDERSGRLVAYCDGVPLVGERENVGTPTTKVVVVDFASVA